MVTLLHGMNDYVLRLETIADECGEKIQKEESPKDLFLRTKAHCYTLLQRARDEIHARQGILQKRGNCFETIERGHKIRQDLADLKKELPKLQDIHKKAQQKRWGATVPREELQARYQDIRVLKRHVDDVNELFNSLSSGETDKNEARATLFGNKLDTPLDPTAGSFSGLRGAAKAQDEDCRRQLSGDEKEALETMRRRDKDIDEQVSRLNEAVQRLDPLAREIGRSAERQKEQVEHLTGDVDHCNDDLKVLNKKLREVAEYDKNTQRCCQIVLIIALLCCVGFVFQSLRGQ